MIHWGTISKILIASMLAASTVGCQASKPSLSGTSKISPQMQLLASPAVSITSPPEGTFITAANASAFTLTGTCSEEGRTVNVNGPEFQSTTCSGGTWTATVDASFAFDGLVTFDVNHSDADGNPAPTASRSYVKDTIPPLSNQIVINGGAGTATSTSATLTLGSIGASEVYVTNTAGCSTGGVWSPYVTSMPWTLAPVGDVATVYAQYRDLAGNRSPCVQDSIGMDLEEPPLAPVVAITSPASGSVINAASASAFTLEGTCSESGQPVVISGAASATVPCDGGTWAAVLNLSSAPDGSVTLLVNHQSSGGQAAPSVSRSFVKDTQAPASNSIVIAGGVEKVSTTSVTLTLSSSGASEMYITNIAGCGSGGTWESYSTSKPWTLGQTEGVATVYARFRDSAGNVSTCVSDTVIHESVVVPALQISPAETTIPSGPSTQVTFVASGGTAPYQFSVQSGPGTIHSTTGVYTAPANATGTTIVRVRDAAMQTADARITHEIRGTDTATFVGTDGPVHAIGVDSEGNRYLGGNFDHVLVKTGDSDDTIRGIPAGNLVKILPDGQVDLAFLARGSQANGTVYAIAVAGQDVFIGGDFTRVNGFTANHIALLNPAGDVNLTFSPQSGPNGFNKTVHALALQGDALYVGGDFHTYRNQSVRGLARISRSGILDTGFSGKNAVNGRVHSLALAEGGTVLYAGGKFNKLGDDKAHRLVKVFTATGRLDPGFNPQDGAYGKTNGTNNDVLALAVDSRNRVYVGGRFNRYQGGFAGPLMRLLPNGSLDSSFQTVVDGPVDAIAVSSSGQVYIGGWFTTANGVIVNGITKLDAAGNVDPAFSPSSGPTGVYGCGKNKGKSQAVVHALVIEGSELLVGGSFCRYRDARVNNYIETGL